MRSFASALNDSFPAEFQIKISATSPDPITDLSQVSFDPPATSETIVVPASRQTGQDGFNGGGYYAFVVQPKNLPVRSKTY